MSNKQKRKRQSGETSNDHDKTNASVLHVHGSGEDGPPTKKRLQRSSLFVRFLPPTATTENLIEHFSQSFPIKHATAVIDPSTKKCKGYGFVSFADSEDAQRAQKEFDGSLFIGWKIKLELAEPRHREIDETAPGPRKSKSIPSVTALQARTKREAERAQKSRPTRLIVRNLPWSIKQPDQLAKLFSRYGRVKSAIIPIKKPGTLSGFGFVDFRGRKNAEKALEGVNGRTVDGRTLAVDWAVDKDTWESRQSTDGAREALKVVDKASPMDGQRVMGTDGETSVEEDERDKDSEHMWEDDENHIESSNGSAKQDDDDEEEEEEGEMNENKISCDKQQQDHSTTLFIRNLPFTCSDDSLKAHFSHFGAVRYARIVVDPNTERPRGTGFVCFFNIEGARQCLRNVPGSTTVSDLKSQKPKTTNLSTSRSILQSEEFDPSGMYTMEGRVLQVCQAVDKSEAASLAEKGRDKRDKDKRRLYLLSEGTISSGSPLYKMLSPSEIAMRESSAKQRKSLVQSNPTLHLSLTRLSVRNLPRSVTSRDLKALAREALVGFAKDVKEGKRQRLSKEELIRGGDAMLGAEKARRGKGKGIVKQATVVYEGRDGSKVTEDSGAGRSRGYGFIEYHSHRSALMGLRWLNGHAVRYQPKENGADLSAREALKERRKRLIVEFAIENAQVVGRRLEMENKARALPPGDPHAREKASITFDSPLFPTNAATLRASTVSNHERVSSTKSARNLVPKTNSEVNGSNANHKLTDQQRIIARKRAVRKGRKAADRS